MNGQLGEQPLAELIREISLKNHSGTLRLEQEQLRAAIYFERGRLIYAAANIRSFRARHLLKSHELLSEEQLKEHTQRSDIELLSSLSSKGIVSQEAVNEILLNQVMGILSVALLLTDGFWNFDQRARLVDPVSVELDVERLLMESARRMSPELVASRFDSPQELISPVPEQPLANNLQPNEGFILSRVDSPIQLKDLLAISGLSDHEACRALYTLALGGYLVREGWRFVLPDDPTPTKVSPPKEEEKVETPPAPTEPEAPEVQVEPDLEAFLVQMNEAQSHYDVLDVGTKAELKEIKRMYYMLARRYHPDRFRVTASPEVHTRLESAFARITQAYETLTDPVRRSTYDGKLAAQSRAQQFSSSGSKSLSQSGPLHVPGATNSPDQESQGAEDNFQEGVAALNQGQANVAVTLLAAAARKAPRDARYRAYYGRALAVNPRTRRVAEAELLTAIKLAPDQAVYRVMLAELYYDLGFLLRAQSEAERALTVEPENAAALELLHRFKTGRT